MDDQQTEVRPILFTQHVALTVDAWPERTAIDEAHLGSPHLRGMTIEGDTVRYRVANGEATYRLRRDLPRDGQGIVADLVEGDTPARLKQRGKKYQEGT